MQLPSGAVCGEDNVALCLQHGHGPEEGSKLLSSFLLLTKDDALLEGTQRGETFSGCEWSTSYASTSEISKDWQLTALTWSRRRGQMRLFSRLYFWQRVAPFFSASFTNPSMKLALLSLITGVMAASSCRVKTHIVSSRKCVWHLIELWGQECNSRGLCSH